MEFQNKWGRMGTDTRRTGLEPSASSGGSSGEGGEFIGRCHDEATH